MGINLPFYQLLRVFPRGVSLGHFSLYFTYLNDLPLSVCSSRLLSFADDTKCYKIINTVTDVALLQEDIVGLGSWSSKWTLPFNISKFAHVEFCLCNSLPHADYSMNGVPIPSCSQHKDLGIILSHDLSWSHHYHYILSKAYSKLGMVRPKFIRDIVKVEQLQRRASKFILHDSSSNYVVTGSTTTNCDDV